MPLSELLSMTNQNLRSTKFRTRFEEARRRVPSLEPYPCVATLLDAIDEGPARRYTLGEPLLRGLVGEYQRRPDELVSGLLLAVCTPLLEGLRARVHGDALDADEFDQLSVTAFLETVADADLERIGTGLTFIYLRTYTSRRLFRAVTSAQQERARTASRDPHELFELLDTDGEDSACLWGPTPSFPPEPDERDEEVTVQTAFLLEHGARVLDEDRLNLVVHTHVLGGRLRDYVDERYAALPEAERERAYQRDKRRHARAVKLLRKKLAPLRRDRDPVGHRAPGARAPKETRRVG